MRRTAAKREKPLATWAALLSVVVLLAGAAMPSHASAIAPSYPETRDRVSSNLSSACNQLESELSRDLRQGYEQSSDLEAVGSLDAPGGGAALRHTEWAGDLNKINATVERLGQRALRQSGGNWVESEALFRRYLGGVEGRLRRTGSSLGIEWQPAAIPGRGRVAAFRQFVDRTGVRRVFATKGSRRLDAGLVDLTQPGRFRPLVSGYDITLNNAKPSIVRYYQEAFGDIPIFDIRVPGS